MVNNPKHTSLHCRASRPSRKRILQLATTNLSFRKTFNSLISTFNTYMNHSFRPSSQLAADIIRDLRNFLQVNFLQETEEGTIQGFLDRVLNIYLEDSKSTDSSIDQESSRLTSLSTLLGCHSEDLRGEADQFMLNKTALLQEDYDTYRARAKKGRIEITEKGNKTNEDEEASRLIFSYDFEKTKEDIVEETWDHEDDMAKKDSAGAMDRFYALFIHYFPHLDDIRLISKINGFLDDAQALIPRAANDESELFQKIIKLLLSANILTDESYSPKDAENFVKAFVSAHKESKPFTDHRNLIQQRVPTYFEDGFSKLLDEYCPNNSDLLQEGRIDTNYQNMHISEDENIQYLTILPGNNQNKQGDLPEEMATVKLLPHLCQPALELLLAPSGIPVSETKVGCSKLALNAIQTKLFPHLLYDTATNILLSAPTGSGKTVVAILSILAGMEPYIKQRKRELVPSEYQFFYDNYKKPPFRAVYLAPMKALVQQVVATFRHCFSYINGLVISELSGDFSLSYTDIKKVNILVTTPEKWNLVWAKLQSEASGENQLVYRPQVIVFDEIHLLHSERGGVVESIVARAHSDVETTQKLKELSTVQGDIHDSVRGNTDYIRMVALSASFPNLDEVARFLRVPRSHIFHFPPENRPVPLTQHFYTIKADNKLARNKLSAELMLTDLTQKILTETITQSSCTAYKSAIVFVHSRADTFRSAQKFLLAQKNSVDTMGSDIMASLGGSYRAVTISNYYNIIKTDGTVFAEPINPRGVCLSTLIECFLESVRTYSPEMKVSAYDLLHCIASSTKVQQHYHLSPYLVDLLVSGVGVHHAGLPQVTRNFIEGLFDLRIIQLLFSTSTLAWGVNLPASTVIVKNDSYYFKGETKKLEALDVIQMFGRAGRPGRDVTGSAYLLRCENKKPFSKENHIVEALTFTQQRPVESFLMKRIVDLLLLEISYNRSISKFTFSDCIDWLKRTYWFTRCSQSPAKYGVKLADAQDQENTQSAIEMVMVNIMQRVLFILHKHLLIRISQSSETLDVKNPILKGDETNDEFHRFQSQFFSPSSQVELAMSCDIFPTTLGRLAASFSISHAAVYQSTCRVLHLNDAPQNSSTGSGLTNFGMEDALDALSSCEELTSNIGIPANEAETLNMVGKNYIPFPVSIKTGEKLLGQSGSPATRNIPSKINILLQLILSGSLEPTSKNRFSSSSGTQSLEQLLEILKSSPSFFADMTTILSSYPRILAGIIAICLQPSPFSGLRESGLVRYYKPLESFIFLNRNLETRLWGTKSEDIFRQIIQRMEEEDRPSDATIRRLESTSIGFARSILDTLLSHFNAKGQGLPTDDNFESILRDVICRGDQEEYAKVEKLALAIPRLHVHRCRFLPISGNEMNIYIEVSLLRTSPNCQAERFFLLITDASENVLFYSHQFEIGSGRASETQRHLYTILDKNFSYDTLNDQALPHLQVKILSEQYIGGAVDFSMTFVCMKSQSSLAERSNDDVSDSDEEQIISDDDDSMSQIVPIPNNTAFYPAEKRDLLHESKLVGLFEFAKEWSRKEETPREFLKHIKKLLPDYAINPIQADTIIRVLLNTSKTDGEDQPSVSRDLLISTAGDSLTDAMVVLAILLAKEMCAPKTDITTKKILILAPSISTVRRVVESIESHIRCQKDLRTAFWSQGDLCSSDIYEEILGSKLLVLTPDQLLRVLSYEKFGQSKGLLKTSILQFCKQVVAVEMQSAFINQEIRNCSNYESAATYEWVLSRLRDTEFYENVMAQMASLPNFICIGKQLTNLECIARWLQIDLPNVCVLPIGLTNDQPMISPLYLSIPAGRRFNSFEKCSEIACVGDISGKHGYSGAMQSILEEVCSHHNMQLKSQSLTIFTPSFAEAKELQQILARLAIEKGDLHQSHKTSNKLVKEYTANFKNVLTLIEQLAGTIYTMMNGNFVDSAISSEGFSGFLRSLSKESYGELLNDLHALTSTVNKGIAMISPFYTHEMNTAILSTHRMAEKMQSENLAVDCPLLTKVIVPIEMLHEGINLTIGSKFNVFFSPEKESLCYIENESCQKRGTMAHAVTIGTSAVELRSVFAKIEKSCCDSEIHVIAGAENENLLRQTFRFQAKDAYGNGESYEAEKEEAIAREEGAWVGEIQHDSPDETPSPHDDSSIVENAEGLIQCQESAISQLLPLLVNIEVCLRSVKPGRDGLFSIGTFDPYTLVSDDLPEGPLTLQSVMEIIQGTYYFQRFALSPSFYGVALSDVKKLQTYPLPARSPSEYQTNMEIRNFLGKVFDLNITPIFNRIEKECGSSMFEKRLIPIACDHLSELVDTTIIDSVVNNGLCTMKEVTFRESDSDEYQQGKALTACSDGITAALHGIHPTTLSLWRSILHRENNEMFAHSQELTASPCNIILALTVSCELGEAIRHARILSIKALQEDARQLEEDVLSLEKGDSLAPLRIPETEFIRCDLESFQRSILDDRKPCQQGGSVLPCQYILWLLLVAHIRGVAIQSLKLAELLCNVIIPKSLSLLVHIAEYCAFDRTTSVDGAMQFGGQVEDVLTVLSVSQGIAQGVWPWPKINADSTLQPADTLSQIRSLTNPVLKASFVNDLNICTPVELKSLFSYAVDGQTVHFEGNERIEKTTDASQFFANDTEKKTFIRDLARECFVFPQPQIDIISKETSEDGAFNRMSLSCHVYRTGVVAQALKSDYPWGLCAFSMPPVDTKEVWWLILAARTANGHSILQFDRVALNENSARVTFANIRIPKVADPQLDVFLCTNAFCGIEVTLETTLTS